MYSGDYAANYNVNKFTLIIVYMRLDESNKCYKHHSGNLSHFRFDCTETRLSGFFILLRRINGKT